MRRIKGSKVRYAVKLANGVIESETLWFTEAAPSRLIRQMKDYCTKHPDLCDINKWGDVTVAKVYLCEDLDPDDDLADGPLRAFLLTKPDEQGNCEPPSAYAYRKLADESFRELCRRALERQE